jgi:hypothetical protein
MGLMTLSESHPSCSLAAAVGRSEACPEEACPFWEPGGAALQGRCAFERLGLSAGAELASWLLEIRERLAAAGSVDEERALRGVFHHLLNESDE